MLCGVTLLEETNIAGQLHSLEFVSIQRCSVLDVVILGKLAQQCSVTEKGWHSDLAAQTILWAELVYTVANQEDSTCIYALLCEEWSTNLGDGC